MKIRAPAKINFGLRVVGKRKDGYHLIDTLMVPVSLYDRIDLRRGGISTGLEVSCDDASIPGGENNLAYKAATLLLGERRIRRGIRIHIAKQIPVGAGLGGGSSDAATVLIGLNRLLGLKYSLKELERISVSLGADVPFFIRGVPARGKGIGDRLAPLRNFPRLPIVILYPGFAVSSAWAYGKLSAKLTKPSVNTSITTLLGSVDKIRRLLVNDLEIVTIAQYPQVGLLKEKLIEAGAAGALMSGSGSSVFGIFDTRRRAEEALRRFKKEEGVQAFLVQPLNQRGR